MTAPANNYLTDAFGRGPTSTGATGSTTGVGNGWIDRVGSVWYIDSSNQLVDASFSNDASTFTRNWLVRPTSENSLNQRITLDTVWNATSLYTSPIALLRVDSANGNAYAAFIDPTGYLVIAKFLNGTNTAISRHNGLTLIDGATYTIDFTAVPNASIGTDLTASVYLSWAGPGSPLTTVTVTGDTTSQLQSALSYGISGGGGSADQDRYAMVALYNASSSHSATATPTMSCSPTTFPLGMVTAFTLTGANTVWTTSTRPKVTGGTNAFVSNMGVSGQTLTGTLNPGSAPGRLTMGNTTDNVTTSVTAAANVINNIVWHGDSLTYGENGSNPGTTNATRLAQVINALGPTWQASNYSNPGHTLSQMISELTATVNGYYDATKQNNILVVQGGHNDIGGWGFDAAQVIESIKSYISTALAAHPWRIIWSTQPPAQYPGAYPANFDSIRDTINTYMRLNWQSLGIAALSDVALDFRMGLDGCEYNSTLYSSIDFTHPTDAGYTIWGIYDLAAIQSLFGSSPRR